MQISLHDIEGQVLRVGIRRAEKARPPLLIFNGIGANIELVEPFLDALDGPEAIVFDVPGVGGSPSPWLPYRPSRLARLSAQLLDQLGHAQVDVLGLSLVTIGATASVETQRLFEGGEYTKYLYLHGLSVETAEALAEYHHRTMRQELGIAGEDSPHIRDLFHQKYRGSRYSFGYPACPNLEDQTKLFALLHPEENVGVRLTTGFLLEPEQSTSAIVVHHPAAKYFVV